MGSFTENNLETFLKGLDASAKGLELASPAQLNDERIIRRAAHSMADGELAL